MYMRTLYEQHFAPVIAIKIFLDRSDFYEIFGKMNE